MQSDNKKCTRVLIVEDEPVLALTLEDLLIDSGFAVVGIAGKLEKALAIISEAAFDIAIIDANLAGVSASPAALALTARGIPFIVVSGYSVEQLPPAFCCAIVMKKPYRPNQLIQILNNIALRQ